MNWLLKLIIIHAVFTQPEHLILARWMGLANPMKNELKTRPCLENAEKNPRSKDENQQQTQPTCNAGSGNRTRATSGGRRVVYYVVFNPRLGLGGIGAYGLGGLGAFMHTNVDFLHTNSI